MNLLYLTPGIFDKGGISRYNRDQITVLRELLGENAVTVISLLGPSNTSHDFEIPFHVEWYGSLPHSSFRSILSFSLQAMRICIIGHPKLIWTAHVNYSTLALLLARSVNALDIVQVYGREIWTRRQGRPDIFIGLKKCDFIVSDCHFTAEYIKEQSWTKKEIEVIWDCVNVNRFTPGKPSHSVLTSYGIPDPEVYFNILTLGRLNVNTIYKGYLRLLDIFLMLPEQSRLIYGGGGDLVPLIKKRAVELGVIDRVIFTGFIDEADLADIYRSASIFCLIGDRGPGRGEGIPLTPLEAAACGIPILVGNQDGSREAVENGISGFALDPFDKNTICDVIKRMILDKEYCLKIGLAARTKIEREHSYPVFRSKMENFLNHINIK